MKNPENLPSRENMRASHKVRRFRRGNVKGEGRGYLGHKPKPWASHNPARSAA